MYARKRYKPIEIFAGSFEGILIRSFGPSNFPWYELSILLLYLGEMYFMLRKQIAEIKIASLLSFIAVISFLLFITVFLFAGGT